MATTLARPAWTAEQIETFDERVREGVQIRLIADELGKSVNAINSRKRLATPSHARRKAEAAARRMREQPALNPDHPIPPVFVLHERNVRCQIKPASTVAAVMGDPKPGYTAEDTKRRRLSVQDAMEICASWTGGVGELAAVCRRYRISELTVQAIISGEWFDRLLPSHPLFNPEL
jgi:hypothetical protein